MSQCTKMHYFAAGKKNMLIWESRRRGVRYQGNLFDRKNTTFFGFFGRKKRHLFFFWTHSASMFPRTNSFVFFKQASKRSCFFGKVYLRIQLSKITRIPQKQCFLCFQNKLFTVISKIHFTENAFPAYFGELL